MNLKKIIPIALALSLTATIPAAAANRDRITTGVAGPLQHLFNQFCTPTKPTPGTPPTTQPGHTPSLSPDTPDFAPPTQVPDHDNGQKPDDETNASQDTIVAQVLSLVNAERAKANLSPLTLDPTVQRAAQLRAQEIVRSFSHTRPNGSSFSSALTEAGAAYRGAGENIAYGQSTPQEVMRAWMNSPGHRANILSKNFTTIGIGYTLINGTPYWAQLFTY